MIREGQVLFFLKTGLWMNCVKWFYLDGLKKLTDKGRVVRQCSVFSLLALCAVSNADHGFVADDKSFQDKRAFTKNSLVRVYLNYDSFKDEDFPSSFSAQALERAIRTAIDRWVQLSGFNLRLRFEGIDNSKTKSGDKEILIQAKTRSTYHDKAVASTTFYWTDKNRSTITFYTQYKSRQNITWTVFPANDLVSGSFLGVLIHEMGHSLGLGHNQDASTQYNTVMNPKVRGSDSFGPFHEDTEDLREQYGKRNKLTVNVKRSTDDGGTWSAWESNLNSYMSQTFLPLTVNRDADKMVAFYTLEDKRPAWIFGDTNAKKWWNNSLFDGERSYYGTAGHGYNNEYMMAWVDHTDDHRVRAVRSTDGGQNWRWIDLPESRAVGTPAIHKVATNTWVLAYPVLDSGNLIHSGRIISRVSTNDGISWGPPVELYSNQDFRSLGGVSIASDGAKQIRIAFAQGTDSVLNGDSKAGSVVTLYAHVNGSQLVEDTYTFDTFILTPNSPVLTKSSNKFMMGYRELLGKLSVLTTTSDSYWWGSKATAVSSAEIVGPSIAARKTSHWAYLFYLD